MSVRLIKKLILVGFLFLSLASYSAEVKVPPHEKYGSTLSCLKCNESTKVDQGDKRGTYEQPLVIQSQKDEKKEKDDHSLAVWTEYLGIATFALAVIGMGQFCMFWLQLRLMVKGSKDAGISARAAQKSAEIAERSLTQLERPYIFAHVRSAGLSVVPGNNGQGSLEREILELVIYNFGRTPAQLTHLEYEIGVANHGEILNSVNPNLIAGRELPVGTISANGDPFIEKTTMKLKFLNEELEIIGGQKSVWIVGFVRYTDFFGNHYLTGFSEVLDVWNGVYVRRGGAEYNYAANEQEADIPNEN